MALLEIVGLLAVAIVLLFYYITKDHNYWKNKNISYEKPVPIFGSLWPTIIGKKNQGVIVAEIYSKYKGEQVVGYFNFMKPALLIRDAEIANRILSTDFQYFANNDFNINEDVDPILSKNMFSQKDEKWKQTRQMLSPAFTVGRTKATYPIITKHSKELVKWLESNSESELKKAISRLNSEIFASTSASIEGHGFTNKDDVYKLGEIIFNSSWGFLFLLISYFPILPKIFRIKFLPSEVPAFFDGLVRDLIKRREQTPEPRSDLLQYYIDLRKKRLAHKNADQRDVSEDDIVAGMVTYFIESYETTAVVTSHLLYELVKNAKLQGELRNEINGAFEKSGGEPSFEDIMELPLLDKCISEANRMYGMQFMFKLCTRDYEMSLNDGRKIHVEGGTSITIPLQAFHRDPQYWENPDQFDPNHFSAESIANRPKNVYLPFGEGPRMCIGMRLAKIVMKTSVSYILRNFDLEPSAKTKMEFVPDPAHFFNFLDGGVYCNLKKRTV